MAFCTATPLWAGRLSMMTMSPRLSVGARHCSIQARKAALVIGPSTTKGAVILSWRSPATKVIVFQCPCGTRPISRSPRRHRPRSRTILVEVEVSSMNTNRAGSNMPCSRIQRRRARATSGRSCSAACRLFFKADPLTAEQSPDRPAAAGDPSLAHRADDLIQRQIRMLTNQHQQPVGMLLQRRDTAPDRLRRDTAGFLPTLYPFDRRTGAHLKPFGRFAPRRTRFDRFKHTFAQVLRTSFRHDPAPKIESLPLDSRIYAFLGIPPIQLSRNML